jgi:hypothetical protein
METFENSSGEDYTSNSFRLTSTALEQAEQEEYHRAKRALHEGFRSMQLAAGSIDGAVSRITNSMVSKWRRKGIS